MCLEDSKSGSKRKSVLYARRVYQLLAARAYTAIMLGALFCTLAVKFFHSHRVGLAGEYFGWILADIAALLAIEVALAAVCFRWPGKGVIRTVLVIAAVICTWSVMNAGWVIRTGTQILPTVLLPLFRDPLNSLHIIGVNLAKMPAAAVILLGPSAVALTFFFSVLVKSPSPNYNRRLFAKRALLSLLLSAIAAVAYLVVDGQNKVQVASKGLRYNCQLRALTSLFSPGAPRLTKNDLAQADRKIPSFDQAQLLRPDETARTNHNVVIVVLEGVQYKHTSLYDKKSNLTPYLADLARQGAEFTNARSTLTHTTKVLFSLLTGRYPSASQDIVEAVPAKKSYASIATILEDQLNYRTAFFQSAKGNFESRPGLVYNLGFDKFWARDDLNDPDAFLGYLACDEFAMLEPIAEWIKADARPFFLTVLCSVTHDPYEVPAWFAEPGKGPLERYLQAVSYTDRFLAELDARLADLELRDKTILCVISDHGEAFGEHGLLGHERIAFDEVLRIPFCLRAPSMIEPDTRITQPVSSVDLTPTLLALLGFDVSAAGFDGANAMELAPNGRKVYFSGWLRESPAGFVRANRKFIFYPSTKTVSVYNLQSDPLELFPVELPESLTQQVADEVINWQKNCIFRLDQTRAGKTVLFDSWACSWTNRIASVNYRPETKN